MKTMLVSASLLAAGVASAPVPARAQQDAAPATRLVDALAACLDIRDDAGRLRCTDAAARRLVDATRRKDVVVVDKAEVRKTRRSLFGFTLPRIGLFGGGDDDDTAREEIDELEAKVTRVVDLGQGRCAITTDGGARWNTTEPWSRGTIPTPGVTILIKRAALGSYFIKIGNTRAVRAMRVG